MIKLSRTCVPLCMECDLNCRYCYRADGKRFIPEFNQLMKNYLGQLSPEWCKAVIASGGEPLLRFDKVQELFSYVPKNIHKRIMTNGLNFTQEIIDFINQNQIEIHLSHDGRYTEYLRGYDILKDKTLLNLILQINDLKMYSVCTNKNPNPYQNYLDIKEILKDKEFRFDSQPIFLSKYFPDLIQNFDFESYSKGRMKCCTEGLFEWKIQYSSDFIKSRSNGFNVLPDGSVVGMNTITHTYGTVQDSLETLLQRKKEFGDIESCENIQCKIRTQCRLMSQLADPIACKFHRIEQDIVQFLRNIREE